MARVEDYKTYIEEIIKRYGGYKPAYGDVEVETIFDRENDRYQLMTVGWNDDQRIHGCILHIDIKDEKIWIQHDGTEEGIAYCVLRIAYCVIRDYSFSRITHHASFFTHQFQSSIQMEEYRT